MLVAEDAFVVGTRSGHEDDWLHPNGLGVISFIDSHQKIIQ